MTGTQLTIRPLIGLTGQLEFFWWVIHDGRLTDSGVADSEAEALATAAAR